MAAPVHETEPTTMTAGDTIAWTKSLADFPSSTWILSYALRYQQGSGVLNVTATASGSDFAVTVPAASSNMMKAGPWVWAGYVTSGSERHQIGTGTIQVFPNLATLDFSTDLRSSAKKAYDNALAAWESVKLGQTVMLNGRTYTQHHLDALTRYVQTCKADYVAELQAEQVAKTGMNPRRVGVRFHRV